MLLIAIPLIWLAIASFFVLLCRAAAAGERASDGAPETSFVHAGFDSGAPVRVRWREVSAAQPSAAGARSVAHRRATRVRGASCAIR